MFYVNNKQVKGIFLNGRNYNYLSYGFGKIIPEDRSVEQLNLNLAQRYLSQYRVEYGNIQSGYDNFPVARLDCPVNGVFHSPFTYYYGGNIVPTKNVPVYINNGYSAIRGPVYNDINVNGNIVYFAANADFQGHNVNIHPENFRSTEPYFNGTVMNNCNNFILHSGSRLSKGYQVTLYDCDKFTGWFNFFGDDDGTRFPGFRGFLHTCRDGVFNFNLVNMHGGGSDERVTNYYNFSCISKSNNIRLTIKGSPWQAWVHPSCYSCNCDINTYNVISGFSYMNDCNFNVVLPKDSKPEMDKGFTFLNNAENCNYNLNALDVNLFNYRSVGYVPLFENLNNCNLNLQVNNTVELGDSFGGNFSHCNIVFDNIKGNLVSHNGWWNLRNCNISGNVKASSSIQGFLERCDAINVNLDVSKSSRILPIWGSGNVNGNLVCGDMTYVTYGTYLNLNVSRGSLSLTNVEHSRFNFNGTNAGVTNLNNCMFEINNSNNFAADGVSSCNFNMRNSVGTARLNNLNNVDFVERGANYTIAVLNNCYNSWIYANTVSGTIGNAYNTRLELKNNNPKFNTWRVDKCELTGFPTSATYTTNCTFIASLPVVVFRNSSYLTWNNVWPHAIPRGSDGWNTLYRTKAGLRSVDNFSSCYLNCNNGSLVAYEGSITFNNINNIQTDIKEFYNGTVTANLPIYNMNIKLNVDCSVLNLGIFQAGPPHGFANSSISANQIFAKGDNAASEVRLGQGCKCFAEMSQVKWTLYTMYNDVNNQPVLVVNNTRIYSNNIEQYGGLSYYGNVYPHSVSVKLARGACMFVNNAKLLTVNVNNSLLFLGTNVTISGSKIVTNGGYICNKANYNVSNLAPLLDRDVFCWNTSDKGPWGSKTLKQLCMDV